MRKVALLALFMTCVSAPAFSQVTQGAAGPAAAPNPVNPGGTTATQTVPSITGGVPNPVSPLGVDPRTQIPQAPLGQVTTPNPQNVPPGEIVTEPRLTPLGRAAVQNPIGSTHPITSGTSTTTQRTPNNAGCGFACGGDSE
jgi:hypothetical protein